MGGLMGAFGGNVMPFGNAAGGAAGGMAFGRGGSSGLSQMFGQMGGKVPQAGAPSGVSGPLGQLFSQMGGRPQGAPPPSGSALSQLFSQMGGRIPQPQAPAPGGYSRMAPGGTQITSGNDPRVQALLGSGFGSPVGQSAPPPGMAPGGNMVTRTAPATPAPRMDFMVPGGPSARWPWMGNPQLQQLLQSFSTRQAPSAGMVPLNQMVNVRRAY